jgi:hypothetical protein
MIPLQIALPSRTPLPDDPGLAPRRPHALTVQPVPAYPALLQAGLFSPDRSGAGGVGAPAGLDQIQIVGVVMIGAKAAALVKPGAGTPELAPVGRTIAGWRLSRIDRNGVLFQRGGESRHLAVGAPAAIQPPAPARPQAPAPASDGDDS